MYWVDEFCSLRTARNLLSLNQDQTVYMLARCHDPKDAAVVVHDVELRLEDFR